METYVIVDIVLLVLLCLTGAMLIALHMRLKNLQESGRSMPLLAKKLADQMKQAQEQLGALGTTLESNYPDLDRKLLEADRKLQEMNFLMERAEKLLESMDEKISQTQKKAAPQEHKPKLHVPRTPEPEQAKPEQPQPSPQWQARVEEPAATPPAAPNRASQSNARRAVSTQRSAALYGQARRMTRDEVREVNRQTGSSDAEAALRKALEGRLS